MKRFSLIIITMLLVMVLKAQDKKNMAPHAANKNDTISQVKSLSNDSLTLVTHVDKMIARIYADLQLTPEQTEKLKTLHYQRMVLINKMRAITPQGDGYEQLNSELDGVMLAIDGVLTEEQKTLQKAKRERKTTIQTNK